MGTELTAAALIAQWREEAGDVSDSLTLRLGECVVRVLCNTPALADALRAYYHDFVGAAGAPDVEVLALDAPPPSVHRELLVVQPEPGKTRVKDEVLDLPDGRLMRKRRTQMMFLIGPSPSIAIGPCRDNLNQVINFVNNRYAQWLIGRGYVMCHAAGVARGGRGLLLAGLAGRGKSTLALHLLGAGLDFVSNDRLLVRREPDGTFRMNGVPKLPRVNPGTVLNNPHLTAMFTPAEQQRFASLSPEELWELEHKYDVDVSRIFGAGRFMLSAEMQAAVILTWHRAETGFDARPADLSTRPDLRRAIMKPPRLQTYIPPADPEPDFSAPAYLAQFAGCPVVELAGGVDFAAATLACQALLDDAPLPKNH